MSDTVPLVNDESTLLNQAGEFDLSSIVALALLILVMTFLAGVPGTLVGMGVALTWAILSTPYAIAVGHVILPAIFANGVTIPELVVLEAAFLVLIVAPTLRLPRSTLVIGSTLVTAVAFGGLIIAISSIHPLWVTGVVFVLLASTVIYTIHRYHLVTIATITGEEIP